MGNRVEWWIGAAGSGKSSRVAEEMRRAAEAHPFGPPVFWVVPESTAFAAETLLMDRVRAAFRVEVVTMKRLADRVCAHGGMARPRLTQVGRQLLLRAAYDELEPSLGPLRRAVRNSSLYHHLLSAFDELTAHGVSPEQLAALLEMSAARCDEVEKEQRAVHRSLVGKLGDVLKLYVRYRQRAEAAGFVDPALLFLDAVYAVPHVSWLEGASLYLDGFHAFSPAERQFISALARRVKRLVITWEDTGLEGERWEALREEASLLPAWPHLSVWLDKHEDRFVGEVQAVAAYHLLACARDFARDSLEQVFCRMPLGAAEGRFGTSPLIHLERALAGHPTVQPLMGIRVSAFGHREEELCAVADEIAHLVQHERVRPRDIAVCVPTLDGIGRRLADELELRGVPVAIDSFSTLADHPVGQLLRAAIAVVRTGFSLDAVAALLRCPLVPVKRREAFDLYLREHDVSGFSAWLAPERWDFAARAPRTASGLCDEEADEIRRHVADALRPIIQVFAEPVLRPVEAARALWELLEAFHVKDTLAQSVVQVGEDPMAGVIHEQAWSGITALLDDLATLQPEVALPTYEVADLVLESMASLRLTRIPSDADAVFVCDFARADNWSRPRVFVVSADDASLPPRPDEGGILRDDERLAFAEVFLRPLGRTSEDERRALECLPYRVMTRASEALVVTYAATDDGIERHLTPTLASLVERGHLTVDAACGEGAVPVHPVQAMRLLADALSRVHAGAPFEQVMQDPVVQDVLTHVWTGATDVDRFQRVLAGLCHRPRPWRLPPPWIRALYGDPIRVSVSRLETYAKCSYRHFAQYALRLEPLALQPEAERSAGTWIHAAVQLATQRLAEDYPRLSELGHAELEAALLEIAHQALEQAAQATKLQVTLERPDVAVYVGERRRHFEFVVRAIWMQLSRGQMRPLWLEKEFRDVDVGEWNGARVVLDGRIDRVDRLQAGEAALCVYDYKSSETALHPSKVYQGLQLQLLIYAAMAMREAEAVEGAPVRLYGAFYMPLVAKRDALDVPPEEREGSAQLGAYRAKGFFLREEAAVLRVNEDLAPGRGSALYGRQFRADGAWAADATAWRDDEWQVVLRHVERRAEEAAKAIAEGEVRVSPYHLSHVDSGCTNCPYNALCHFERADHFDLYRSVPKLKFDDVIAGGDAN
ncbi:PD-(D/E)XK nuclease family protein [Alicyclobacillus acidocaldarius]|uniref:ATP-dependent nuclease subunit B-like protein n=1 Tax=Alicyclobacillus acidocaldarius (strain Tc-4-1) TaxID=1048834 RepID=F8IFL8_ALIAT|nr:PD-(D/E)XK nuclease family protein [Alicyclobacillus acidocaldarius]AEJ44102.1 ATP-dependent nuclease subunit B-like protein [Alicyclobacillus acidocaldarius subsp. acidocaldarius Tc-4-1]